MKEYKSKINKVSLVREPDALQKVKISCSKDLNEYARKLYGDDLTLYESFFVIMLNQANNTIGFAKISQGGTTGTYVDVKLIAKYALESLATQIILVHNHPSGTLKASEADKKITERIKGALELFEIRVLDHIILTEDGYFSFCDELIL